MSPHVDHPIRPGISIMSILGDVSAASPARAASAPPPHYRCPNGYPAAQHHHHHKHHHHAPPPRRPRLVVLNDAVLASVSHLPRVHLGTISYAPLLPRCAPRPNATIAVHIPARLIPCNPRIPARALWGTDIYTDDSDLVAVLQHSGHLPHPWADALCTLRILPPLKRYAGCTRNAIRSRSWAVPHDGMSFMLEKVEWAHSSTSRRRKQTQLQLDHRQRLVASDSTVLNIK